MRRLSDDRGAVAVLVALIMVPLLVCTALVIDMGAGYVRKRQLQNAADAAVLAVAQDCAAGTCGSISTTATNYTNQNVPGVTATATPVLIGTSSARVTTSSVVNFSFAPVIGVNQQTVTATATATWGTPVGGTAVLPLAFSWCAFNAQANGGIPAPVTPYKIYTSKGDGTTCHGPSGNDVPGGFGWLDIDPGSACSTTTSLSNIVTSNTGNAQPCSDSFFTSQLNKTVLLPVYDSYTGNGNNGSYHIYAYAAFHLTDFNFGGAKKNYLEGYFTSFVDVSDAFTYGTGNTDTGTKIISLTN